MGESIPQVSFASGEIAPSLAGRIDFQGYRNGLRTCRNFIVQKFGGVQNRPGTRFISEVADSSKFTRLIPFQFSNDQTYVLEFGDQVMRVYKDGALLTNVAPTAHAITNVTSGVMRGSIILSFPQITCPGHGFASTDTVVIAGVLGATQVNGTWAISVVDADTFELVGPIPSVTFYSTTTSDYAGGGTASAPQVGPVIVQTPWASADLPLLKYVQSNDVLTVCHPDYPPQQISRYSDVTWRVAQFQPVNGPFLDLNVDQTKVMYVSGVVGDITITASFNAFTSDQVGMLLRVEQPPDDWTPAWEVQKTIGSIGFIVKAGANYYVAASTGTTGTVQPTHLEGSARDGVAGVVWVYIHSGYGVVQISAVTDIQHATAKVLSRLPESLIGSDGFAADYLDNTWPNTNLVVHVPSHTFSVGDVVSITGGAALGLPGTYSVLEVKGAGSGFPGSIVVQNRLNTEMYFSDPQPTDMVVHLGTANHSYKWAFQAWGVSEGFPAATAYFEQRQVFGGTNGHPSTVQMSRTAGYLDFGTGIPVLDDDAISVTVFSNKANQIRHFLELSSLIVLTSGGIFVMKGSSGGDGVLTPASVQARPQSANSCSHVPPLRVDHYGLFVQEKGSQVRSLAYSFSEDSFVGQDITVLSSHLFAGKVLTDWAFQEIPNSCIWAVRDDGTLLGLTFVPDQQVTAWHRHDTDGAFESVCCVSENNEDVVYFVVRRTVNGVQKRYIERMDTRAWLSLVDAFFVDCGLSFDGRNTSSTHITITGGVTWASGELLNLISDTPVFAPTDVGDQIIFTGSDGAVYRLTINFFANAYGVSAFVNRDLPAEYQNAPRLDWSFARDKMAGLDHLEGKTVSVLADGNVQEQKVVTGGAIVLDQPAVIVHVGLPIIADFETLEVTQGRDKKKNTNRVSLMVNESSHILAGPDASHLYEYKQRALEGYDEPADLVNELITFAIDSTWDKASRVFVRQDQPLPLSILAVMPEVTAGGS